MKKEPLFPKKEKQDVDHLITEAGVRLRGLQRKYRVIIERNCGRCGIAEHRRGTIPRLLLI